MTLSRIDPAIIGKLPTIDESRRVIRFRPLSSTARGELVGLKLDGDTSSPVNDFFLKYEQRVASDEDHRLLVNALAAVVLILLILVGRWLICTMAVSETDRDCRLSDGSNCSPIFMMHNWGGHRNKPNT